MILLMDIIGSIISRRSTTSPSKYFRRTRSIVLWKLTVLLWNLLKYLYFSFVRGIFRFQRGIIVGWFVFMIGITFNQLPLRKAFTTASLFAVRIAKEPKVIKIIHKNIAICICIILRFVVIQSWFNTAIISSSSTSTSFSTYLSLLDLPHLLLVSQFISTLDHPCTDPLRA